MIEPTKPRCIAYADMQWFFRTAKFMFGTKSPSFNPRKIARHICEKQGWDLVSTKAYLDVPALDEFEWWAKLWRYRVEDLEAQGVNMWVTPQRQRQALSMTDNGAYKVLVRSDIEVTLRLSLDCLSDVILDRVDVVILLTKENKYVELVEKLKAQARAADRYLKIVSAFPYTEGKGKNPHVGIDRVDWWPITADVYKECSDYVRKPKRIAELVAQSNIDVESQYAGNAPAYDDSYDEREPQDVAGE